MQDHHPVLTRRFTTRLDGSPAIEASADGGILLSAVPVRTLDHDDLFALVLLADVTVSGAENPGASVTNSVDLILREFAGEIAMFAHCPIQHILWIELDSAGNFDHLLPSWPAETAAGTRPERVDWAPLHSPTKGRRTARAFTAVWDPYGQVLLASTAQQLRCSVSDFYRQVA
jgi:hypothetical protein